MSEREVMFGHISPNLTSVSERSEQLKSLTSRNLAQLFPMWSNIRSILIAKCKTELIYCSKNYTYINIKNWDKKCLTTSPNTQFTTNKSGIQTKDFNHFSLLKSNFIFKRIIFSFTTFPKFTKKFRSQTLKITKKCKSWNKFKNLVGWSEVFQRNRSHELEPQPHHLDHGDVRVGRVIGEVQTSPESWIVAEVVPQATHWQHAFAQSSSRKICKDLPEKIMKKWIELWVVLNKTI